MNARTRAVLENLNYYNDHRVIAAEKDPWFISTSPEGEHIAVQVPTKDYDWLTDHGYDPEEQRPEEDGEFRWDGQRCYQCSGTGVELVDRKDIWKDPYNPSSVWKILKRKRGRELSMLNYRSVGCRTCLGHGRHRQWHKYAEPRLHPDAEDRIYRPWRVVAFPCQWEDCGTCDGRGKHVNPSIDAGGLTREDFDRDPGFEAAYFSGAYDVTCYECNGEKRMPVIDTERLHDDEKALYAAFIAYHEEKARDEAAYAAERRAEMRMGC